MASVLGGDSNHQRVSHNSGEAISNRFLTASRSALVMRGLPLEERRSGRGRTCVYLYRIAGTM